jgi:hypothetical protein
MAGVKSQENKGKGGEADARSEREKRLAEALRANLRRRKAPQAPSSESPSDSPDESKDGERRD